MTNRTLTDSKHAVTGLEHCGNSPRMAITADLVVAWAEGDDATLTPWFADDVSHTVVGHPSPDLGPSSPGERHGVADTLRSFRSPGTVTHLAVHGLLSHGKEAACDGTATLADGHPVDFAHHFTFASAGRQAKVRSIRTYLIPGTV